VIEPLVNLETTLIGGQDVVVVNGEVDLSTAGELQAAIAGFSSQILTVDLRGVEFIDSAGLAVLMKEHARLRGNGGELRLVVKEKGPVSRILELTGVAETFRVSNSL